VDVGTTTVEVGFSDCAPDVGVGVDGFGTVAVGTALGVRVAVGTATFNNAGGSTLTLI
jgi:hypothetical protein